MTGGAEWVLGVDSGGSGLRIALARAGSEERPSGVVCSAEPVRTGPSGIDAGHLLGQVLPAVRALLEAAGTRHVAAAAVGAAGMASLGDDLRARLPDTLADELGVRRLALAADAVAAYAGALGQRPGAVVAAGTGLIALGTDLGPSGIWRRADGWGHLLGDCGGGAWIGRAGLEAALRAHDGRGRGSTALLERVREKFGPPAELPGKLYPRTDRPAVLASFAPEVARCAPHDRVAARILSEAARNIAEAATAVCPREGDCFVAFTGGLLRLGPPLMQPLLAELTAQAPRARCTEAEGDPLDGALRIARALAADNLRFPVDGLMLHISERRSP
ncbi:ATPase [Streptomyces sp. MTZ3.1]|uniref:ATPase n=1 Tax=Streptomyces meridianus TaxID=2938945 RepID=A0ABT0XBC8_9ACTN|nr:BadF/BadG/BcrA/BcrD ATPase family protein [Streptomyces meridianus]MCM2579822.1 ATPase [Streptomyces meridianus]